MGLLLPCSLKDTSNCVFIFDIPSVCIYRRLFAAGRHTGTHVLLQVLQVDRHKLSPRSDRLVIVQCLNT